MACMGMFIGIAHCTMVCVNGWLTLRIVQDAELGQDVLFNGFYYSFN